jgi:hypothetical protein
MMPNWCMNNATISGPKPLIDELKAVLNDPDRGLLQWMVPNPSGEWDYNWSVAHWGTKWDVQEVFISDDAEEDAVSFSFDTAWAPPLDAFQTWARADGRVSYRVAYYEPGMAFVGWQSWDGVFTDEEYVEHGQDPGRFWEIAGEEFGAEPEEEPEPLTEWYTEGVREKGLSDV